MVSVCVCVCVCGCVCKLCALRFFRVLCLSVYDACEFVWSSLCMNSVCVCVCVFVVWDVSDVVTCV